MELHLLLALGSLLLFSFCARCLIQAMRKPIPQLNFTEYSKLALRVRKAYAVTALSIMTLSFLSLLTFSWIQIFELV